MLFGKKLVFSVLTSCTVLCQHSVSSTPHSKINCSTDSKTLNVVVAWCVSSSHGNFYILWNWRLWKIIKITLWILSIYNLNSCFSMVSNNNHRRSSSSTIVSCTKADSSSHPLVWKNLSWCCLLLLSLRSQGITV